MPGETLVLRRRRLPLSACALAVAVFACGTRESQPRARPVAGDTAGVAHVTDVRKERTDSALRAGVPRDSAFGPKMEVDSAGRLRPLKKP
ncbi:MAG: hypothetical protein ACHQQ3_09900 [Gemmatimonadales bacterium]